MTRRFYTDPLEAAFMAKHHGMDFVDRNLGDVVIPEAHLHEKDCEIYIHPDSLYLLKPVKGDLMQWGAAVFVYGEKVPEELPSLDEPCSIIQRDSKAFFWPQQEAA